jgi:hypothetical protein
MRFRDAAWAEALVLHWAGMPEVRQVELGYAPGSLLAALRAPDRDAVLVRLLGRSPAAGMSLVYHHDRPWSPELTAAVLRQVAAVTALDSVGGMLGPRLLGGRGDPAAWAEVGRAAAASPDLPSLVEAADILSRRAQMAGELNE